MTTESIIQPVPDNWRVMTLGEACSLGGGNVQTGPFGSQLHAEDYVPIGIPSVMPQNIGDNRINVDGIAHISPRDAQRLSRYLLESGDIVYSRRGDVQRRALVRDASTVGCRPQIAKWWLPDAIVFLDAISKTGVGKFDKKLLREQFKQWKPKE